MHEFNPEVWGGEGSCHAREYVVLSINPGSPVSFWDTFSGTLLDCLLVARGIVGLLTCLEDIKMIRSAGGVWLAWVCLRWLCHGWDPIVTNGSIC